MSLPNVPNITPTISLNYDETINLLLASIALEEISFSHILNAEGEKLQSFLATCPTSLCSYLEINESINKTLRNIARNQMLLSFKLEDVIELEKNRDCQEDDGYREHEKKYCEKCQCRYCKERREKCCEKCHDRHCKGYEEKCCEECYDRRCKEYKEEYYEECHDRQCKEHKENYYEKCHDRQSKEHKEKYCEKCHDKHRKSYKKKYCKKCQERYWELINNKHYLKY